MERLIEQFRESGVGQIYLPKGKEDDSKQKRNIVLYTHALEMGGAPMVLCELGKILLKEYNVFVISPEDGILHEMFTKSGMCVLICPEMSEETRRVVEGNMEFAVANTILALVFVCKLLQSELPIYWWIHESMPVYEGREELKPYYCLTAQRAKIYAAGKVAQENFFRFCGIQTKILEFGVKDVYEKERDRSGHERIRFICPSTIQYIKGQDILAGVIQLLPEAYRKKCEFVFIGEERDYNRTIYQEIKRMSDEYDNVKLYQLLTKEELMDLYYDMDVVLAPSREDATPATIVEGMMYHKICICADSTGISRYMTNGVDGYVFEKENILDALEKVKYVIEHFDEQQEVREAGRRLYEKIYQQSVFEKNVWKMVGGLE